MTPDHSALIERLEAAAESASKTIMSRRGQSVLHPLLAEAAAALRDQQADLEKWKRLKGYADDQVKVERAAYRSLLADHEGRALPSAPNQAKGADKL